jgi:pyruvate,water dikinase
MTFTQLWGALLIFLLCPLLGGLPLIRWIAQALAGKDLKQLGTGNISVSAAFYHGGRGVGILAVLSEAAKGIAAVLLARHYFPANPEWEIIALMALVMGRYWFAKGAGTTNVVWGYWLHDPITALLTAIIGGIGFTLLRERQSGRLSVLVLLPLLTAFRHPQSSRLIGANLLLSLLIGWIYYKIPDDLDLPTTAVQSSSRQMFRFFRSDRAMRSLDDSLRADQMGSKAASLSQLKRWGYPVPMGWVLPPGDDAAPLVEALNPAPEFPLAVRSSAIGEDSETASAAGQYDSLLNVISRAALTEAILRVQASYNQAHAVRYRQDRAESESGMAVLVQIQVQGVFSGVAFSRDPLTRQGEAVVIEALPGMATAVVSGRVTPEQYRVWVETTDETNWRLPETVNLPVEGSGEVPPRLIQQVAYLARQLEMRLHGIPQDIEWSYDGSQLWLLQARPITTLLPIWTRKIAAEVIPGYIHPLTWSINQPLTCGVWGEIFTQVLGQRAAGLDFTQTATLHRSAAYFNASLLGDIFRRMGLPAESLEFLTLGAKFSRPPFRSTLRNLPGLLRLLGSELRLEQAFEQDDRQQFQPGLASLAAQPVASLMPEALLSRIQQILALLKRATYYSIMAPLSAALRQGIWRAQRLDYSQMPEVAAVRAIRELAEAARPLVQVDTDPFAELAASAAGQALLQRFEQFFERYGYLSEVGTDIAVPTWKEDPRPVKALFRQFLQQPDSPSQSPLGRIPQPAQRRLNLKGRVTACYSQLLAELRWSFLALEQRWMNAGQLNQAGDIFFLTIAEVETLVADSRSWPDLPQRIAQRRAQLEQDRQHNPPLLVYGNQLAQSGEPFYAEAFQSEQSLQGIGASAGQVQGRVQVLQSFQDLPDLSAIDRQTILVVPYTDSGWAVLLARAGGLIAEVGGQLSHGAIVAREYGIPAVMNVTGATQRLRTGEQVRLDGSTGRIDRIMNQTAE